ncbi:hypothetical protein K0M31_009843, partial [Melipona bicolor]
MSPLSIVSAAGPAAWPCATVNGFDGRRGSPCACAGTTVPVVPGGVLSAEERRTEQTDQRPPRRPASTTRTRKGQRERTLAGKKGSRGGIRGSVGIGSGLPRRDTRRDTTRGPGRTTGAPFALELRPLSATASPGPVLLPFFSLQFRPQNPSFALCSP